MFRGKGVVALALVLGLATSMLVWYYLDRATAEARPLRTAPVVVALKDIPPRTLITAEMVKLVNVPMETRLPNALVEADAPIGKVTKIGLMAQEQVLSTKLFADRKESGLAFVIPPGRRAVSVEVSEVISSGGLLVPGDRVDVVVVYREQDQSKAFASTVLQNIEVLAVAQLLEGDDRKPVAERSMSLGGGLSSAASAMGGSGSKTSTDVARKVEPPIQPTAKTATLSVTPEEAPKLLLADEFGTIRLSLRPHNEATVVAVPDITLGVGR